MGIMRIRLSIHIGILFFVLISSCSFNGNEQDAIIVFDIKDFIENIPIYEISDAESIAANHLESNLRYFMPWGINFDNLNDDLLYEIHYDFGDYITPVGTSETAFSFHKLYLEQGDEIYLLGFRNNVNWLLNNLNDEYYLQYDFDWIHAGCINLKSGWVSSMAQGEALAAFCMAYDLLNESVFLEAAENVFQTLQTNTTNFWCINLDENNYYWQEEYPNSDNCHVLNGIFFGVWGLWNYYALTGDDLALKLFEASIRSIIDNHHIWDCEGVDGSRYCKHRENPDPNYHPIHINQLTWYADYFGIDEFYEIIDEFRD